MNAKRNASDATILVLGGTGMLGRALVGELDRRDLRHAAPPRGELDLRAPGMESWLRGRAPSAVLNATAYTDVGAAERPGQRDDVYALNRDIPRELARICRELGVPFVHLSTDYVFDGIKRAPYREDDPPAPLQEYGRSKLEGEREVMAANGATLVVRTSTLYGPGPRPRPHYVDAVLRNARENGRLELVRPPVSSPTYAPDLAEALIELLQAGAAGIVHWANAGACSRFELAVEAVRAAAGLLDRIHVRERPEPPGGLARPAYSVLDTARYTSLTGKSVRSWQDALRDYVRGQAA